MGWDGSYHWTSKAIAVAEILREYGSKVETYKVTATGIWYIYNFTDSETKQNMRMIVIDLLERHGSHWSRKSVSEDMGPYEHDCPLEFLAMCPPMTGSQYALDWRARVVSYHAAKAKHNAAKRALQIGDSVKLTNGWELTILTLKPFIGERDGQKYRIPKKMLDI